MRVTTKQLSQALYELTEGKTKPEIEKIVADFARYLQKERKLKLAGKVIEQFGKIYNQKNDIVEAEVMTAEKPSDALEKKIENYIKRKYKSEKVILKSIVDSKIKGGMIIRVEDEVMDGSIHGKLEELKKILTN